MYYRPRRQKRFSILKLMAGLLIASAIGASALVGASASTAPEPRQTALAREILRELIDTRSTHDVGSTDLARKVQARLLAAGFAPADAQLLIPADHPRAGNVVARLHGRFWPGSPWWLRGQRRPEGMIFCSPRGSPDENEIPAGRNARRVETQALMRPSFDASSM